MFGRSKLCHALMLDPFTWKVTKKGKIPMPESQTCVQPVMTRKTTGRRHSPTAMYVNMKLRGQEAAVHARTQFHATDMPRAQC